MTAQLIAIEGSDGAGKETQTNLLFSLLETQAKKVARVSFPRYNKTLGGTLLFEVMKSERAEAYNFSKVDPKVASKLYAMDREESLPYLQELLQKNDIVILDRYVESNLLHQGGKYKNVEERRAFAEWLFKLEYVDIGLPQPHKIIYLSLPFSISKKRTEFRSQNGGSKLDAVEKDLEYVKAGHEAGIFYAEYFGWTIIEGLEGNRELTPEEIHEKIALAVEYIDS